MQVELDVFSGRPNPTWNLSEREATEFQNRLAALPPAPPAERMPGLGYRGLVVRNAGGQVAGMDSIAVGDGIASSHSHARAHYFRDEGRELEKWLLSTGESHLDPALYQEIARQIGMAAG